MTTEIATTPRTTTAIAAYSKIGDLMGFIRDFGTDIAKSRLLGCETVEQGRLMAAECVTRGCTPLTLAARYDIIQGKMAMKSAAMLAAFNDMGGKHKLLCRTPDKAEIELSIGREKQRFCFTWEEAQQEKYIYQKDGKTLKDNWATPRGRMHMLWWRVVSEGVDVMEPRITAGYGTVAEYLEDHSYGADVIDADFTVDDRADNARNEEATAGATDDVVTTGGQAGEGEDHSTGSGSQDAKQPGSLSPDQEAPTAVAMTAATRQNAAAATPSSAPFKTVAPGDLAALRAARKCSDDQAATIKQLIGEAGLSREQSVVLISQAALFEGAKLADLSVDQASGLIGKLRDLIALRKTQAAEQKQADQQERSSTPGAAEPINGPISDEQVRELRGLAEQIEAAEPGFREKLNDQLKSRGFGSIKAMSRHDGIGLLNSLSAKVVKLRMEGKIAEAGKEAEVATKADGGGGNNGGTDNVPFDVPAADGTSDEMTAMADEE